MKSKLKCITWVQQMYKHCVSVNPLSNKKYYGMSKRVHPSY